MTLTVLPLSIYVTGILARCATKKKRDDLHLLAADPLYNSRREWAFLEMSQLLADAIEEVRVLSVSLREHSQAVCDRADALRQHSTALIERRRRTSDHLGDFTPWHQEIPEVERRKLDISESTSDTRRSPHDSS